MQLVIVGQPAWLSEPILEAAAQRPYTRLLGFVADEDLPALYRQATAFAFPSLYEGFGIPILEAMASGRPIITTDVPGCRETVVPEANGLMVPPKDAEALALAMRRFIAEPSLVARLGMASREIAESKYAVVTVSYTHLTLPTIYSL